MGMAMLKNIAGNSRYLNMIWIHKYSWLISRHLLKYRETIKQETDGGAATAHSRRNLFQTTGMFHISTNR